MRILPSSTQLMRALGVLLCSLAFLSVLGGSTCIWSADDDDSQCYDDDDDNDAFCDDDDDFNATAGGASLSPDFLSLQEGLLDLGPGVPLDSRATSIRRSSSEPAGSTARLTNYVLELESRPGRHPVARVRDIVGLAVGAETSSLAKHPLTLMGAEDFRLFSADVLAANDDLLGLPEGAGELRPRSVHFLDQLVAVVFEQLPGDAASEAQVIFAFDLLGRLLLIENRTILPPGIEATVPDELLRP